MSKAYNSVNSTLLEHALTHLLLPTNIVNTLLNILKQCHYQLGTYTTLSSSNGIDKGETITPLLWRIYYDSLISYIYSNSSGYTIKTSWFTNLKNFTTNNLQTKCSVLAYMDDTL